ncbi:MAG: hypothetical protein ACRCWQ_05970 [Bacilli bacterium]
MDNIDWKNRYYELEDQMKEMMYFILEKEKEQEKKAKSVAEKKPSKPKAPLQKQTVQKANTVSETELKRLRKMEREYTVLQHRIEKTFMAKMSLKYIDAKLRLKKKINSK